MINVDVAREVARRAIDPTIPEPVAHRSCCFDPFAPTVVAQLQIEMCEVRGAAAQVSIQHNFNAPESKKETN
jgi:hypothetical protein